jgi:hypothetical protein
LQQNIMQSFQFRGRHLINKLGLCLAIVVIAMGMVASFHTSQAHAETTASAAQQDGSYAATIRQVFGQYGNQAVAIASCESTLNPNAYNGILGAAGLFQIIPGTWASTSEARQSAYNPYANIQAAHEIFARDGYSWSEWQCRG